MNLLINGMDMPTDCAGCDLSYYRDGYNGGYGYSPAGWKCRRLNHIIKEGEETRPSDCPLSEIPTPHGDLIDRGHLLDMLDKIILKPDSYGQRCMAMATKEILIRQTPVIKAEGKS